MKILNKISGICLATLAALLVFSCQQDELVKPSALKVVSSVTIPAQSSEGTALTIYSDDDWMVDTAQEWLQVTPVNGTGTMDITIIAEDNVVDGIVQRPRQGEIVIANKRGYSVKCIVYQGGDNYLGAAEKSIAEVKAMEDGSIVKLPEVQVVAATAEGFVASDSKSSMYIVSKTIPAIGSKVFIAGEKTTLYSLASLTAGEIQVVAEGEASHPDPVDLTTNLDPENAKDVVYVSTLAGILGNKLYYESTLPVSVSVLQPGKDIDIEKVNMHNIAIEAYYVGIEDGDVKLALVTVEDKGINEQLDAYFYDDFSWMKSFIDASGVDVGDSIKENNSSASAPNLRSTASLANLLEELTKRGYEDLNPSAKVIYPQTYYWKFGKTSTATANNNNGLILPPIEFKGDELVNAIIEFDWAAHMTGSG
ncbi:MAG: BACON domain-containing protein, partial [Bacteroidales bacterium]|nr:BACON domain-containing protein [Bacteroidales bacterium]